MQPNNEFCERVAALKARVAGEQAQNQIDAQMFAAGAAIDCGKNSQECGII